MRASDTVWFNGTLAARAAADPSVASNTLHLGLSVFDGIMAYWNRDHWYLHFGREHLERFHDGADRMDLTPHWSVDHLLGGVFELLDALPKRTHYLRPIAYRRSPEVFMDVNDEQRSVCIFAVPAERDIDKPSACELSPIQRVSHRAIPATWKVSGAYVNSYLAERHARAAGYDTGVMLDVQGRIAEAAISNMFFLQDNQLITPRLNGDVFPGITRGLILRLAATCDLMSCEREVWPTDLEAFDAALHCGTLSELRPIHRIGDQIYTSADDPRIKRLIDAFRTVTHT